MSDPKDFLARWSRRKLGPAEPVADAAPVPLASPEGSDAARAPAAEFDPATLPSIESIGAGSDIRAFLQQGVPPGLTRAALRRAWASDPAIRDFVGLSENAWDFNAPDSIPGFGSLLPEDIRRLAAQLLGEPGGAERSGDPGPERNPLVQPASVQGETEAASMHEVRRSKPEMVTPDQVHDLQPPEDGAEKNPLEGQRKVDVAVQYKEEKPEYDKATLGQRHGGALPKQT
jgi:hypothetical protein